MSKAQPLQLPIFVGRQNCPYLPTLVQATVSIFIGRWRRLWWLKSGGATQVLLSSFAIDTGWTPVPSVQLTLRRYYALPELQIARTD